MKLNNICADIVKRLPPEYWTPCIDFVSKYAMDNPECDQEQLYKVLKEFINGSYVRDN